MIPLCKICPTGKGTHVNPFHLAFVICALLGVALQKAYKVRYKGTTKKYSKI